MSRVLSPWEWSLLRSTEPGATVTDFQLFVAGRQPHHVRRLCNCGCQNG